MDMLEQSGKPTLCHETKDLLRQISPATIDRLLSTHRPKFPKGYLGLNPVEICHRMEENLSKLWRCDV
ncbi:hypothetical protein DRJ23_06105 [Candidatus Acetothermia bacterium]|nr:MAG: hypothetical protein DRJ23_06105 [Candidatus Acetothermia bacterium]